jgi:hypothetical protein
VALYRRGKQYSPFCESSDTERHVTHQSRVTLLARMALAGARRCVLRAAPPAGRLLRSPPALRRSRATRAAPPRAAAATTHLKELRIKARPPSTPPHCPPAPVP